MVFLTQMHNKEVITFINNIWVFENIIVVLKLVKYSFKREFIFWREGGKLEGSPGGKQYSYATVHRHRDKIDRIQISPDFIP